MHPDAPWWFGTWLWFRRFLCLFGMHRWQEVLVWDDGFEHAICVDCELVECSPPTHTVCPICEGHEP